MFTYSEIIGRARQLRKEGARSIALAINDAMYELHAEAEQAEREEAEEAEARAEARYRGTRFSWPSRP